MNRPCSPNTNVINPCLTIQLQHENEKKGKIVFTKKKQLFFGKWKFVIFLLSVHLKTPQLMSRLEKFPVAGRDSIKGVKVLMGLLEDFLLDLILTWKNDSDN